MEAKASISFILIIGFFTFAYCIDPDFHPEAECNARGGICTLASNCPHEIAKDNFGLCPKQQTKGAECCNEIPIHLKDRCKSYGGECVANCPEKVRQTEAKDCPKRTHCCVWLTK